MALERARGRPGALHSCSHRQRQGALGHPDPVCPDSWEGRCRGLNGCFRDQPGDFPAQHVRQVFSLAEDESLAHVLRARQDARHDRHRVNGRHPAPPASVPPAPTAVRPVRRAALHCRRQTQGLLGPARRRGTHCAGSMEAQCRRSAAFDCTPQPAACCPDWMARLPDALPLSRLSIPGTHDSLSLFGGRRLRCQSWGLEAQLAAGIRFLDVRCKLARGELHVYHLCTFQRASLRGVLRRTLRFLRAHPGEAVLMRIKEELPIFPRPGFAARLHRCLLEEGRGHVWCREEVPTLGQVRGKIVVLEALAREVLGIPYEQLSISDAWNVLSLERKWVRARRHLERAAGGDPATMHLTFCSGNGLFTCPEEVARFVNPRCYQHLRRRGRQPVRWGVVIMDFPGAGLLRLIVESNAPRAGRHSMVAPGTPTASLQHPRGRGDGRRSRHSYAHRPRRCPSGRMLLPAPRLCRRTSAPVERKRFSSSCWAPGSLRVTTV